MGMDVPASEVVSSCSGSSSHGAGAATCGQVREDEEDEEG